MKNRFYAVRLGGFILLVYLFQLVFPSLTSFLGFRVSLFPETFWTIFTSFFIHSTSDYMHLLNNLFFLTVFGTVMEHYTGSKRFFLFFIAAGIFANISAFFFYPGSLVLGASGAVSGIIAFLAVYKPNRIGLFWGVPLPMWLVGFMWLITNLLAFGSEAGIAFEAHVFGLSFGGVVGIFYRSGKENKDEEEFEIDERSMRMWEDSYMD